MPVIRSTLPLLLLSALAWGPPLRAHAQIQVGSLYAAEFGDGTVVEITGGGDVSAAPRFATGLNGPRDLCIGPNGDLYVSEFQDDEVTIISAGGDFTGAPAFATGIITPTGLDCSDTRILVTEFFTGEVTDITAGGDFTGAPHLASGIAEAVDVLTAADGTIYVSDDVAERIYDVTAGGVVGAPFAFSVGRTRGLAEWNGMLLVATPIPFEVKDATTGGDLSAGPVFASGIGAQVLHPVPGLGLFATFNSEVYEISAGGDFSLAAPFATGLLPITGDHGGFGGLAYVPGCNDGILQPDEDCEDGNTAPGDGCDEQCLFEVCGNGVVQVGEECDDGNTVGGDGCDASCLLEFCGDGIVSTGEACDDANTVDGDGCSADCTAATFCTAAPDPACVAGAKAKLSVDERKPGKEKLKASLKKLQGATLPGDFGDPVGGATVYELCVYDGGDALVATLPVDRAGDVCGPKAKPCWRASKSGLKYKDPDAASAGVKSIKTKAGDAGKGKLQVSAANKAKKGQVALPTGVAALLQGQAAATVQVHTSDALCFGAALPTVKRADALRFQAKAP